MSETKIREEPQAGSPLCDANGHAWVWTWPIEGGEGSVGQCSLCGRITTAERDARIKAEAWDEGYAAARAEVARLRAVVEAVQALADEWEKMQHRTGRYPEESAYNDGREGQAEACADALRAALAPVSSSWEAESGEACGAVDPKHDLVPSCQERAGHQHLHCSVAEGGARFLWANDTPAPVSSGGQAERRKARAKAAADRLRTDVEAAGGAEQLRRLASLDAGGQADELPAGLTLAETLCSADDSMWHHEATDDYPCSACVRLAARLGPRLAARPVLSREALLLALARADGQPWASLAEATEHTAEVMYGKQADAVLDVLAGEQR